MKRLKKGERTFQAEFITKIGVENRTTPFWK
jgi:hypothetical protein